MDAKLPRTEVGLCLITGIPFRKNGSAHLNDLSPKDAKWDDVDAVGALVGEAGTSDDG